MEQAQQVTEPIQVGEAAEILNVDRKTVHRLIVAGKLNVYRQKHGPRGARLILESEVRALAAERRADLEKKLPAMGGAA